MSHRRSRPSRLRRATRAALLTVCALAAPTVVAVPAAHAAVPPTNWACRPDVTPNPCLGSLDTTVLSSTTLQPRKVARVDHAQNAADPKVDCFYVYPTVSDELRPTAPRHISNEVTAILKYQAARFSQQCRVFAPIYRQITLPGFVIGTKAQQRANADRAYGDVLNAWNEYLAHDNHGRGVVFIGHSQGSQMLIRLLSEQVDPSPVLRAKVVSAIILGGNLSVLKGQRAGGDFQDIPTCATASEIGCVIAYSTFTKQPSTHTLFGNVNSSLRRSFGLPTDATKYEVACVSPGDLSGDGGLLETYSRTESFPGLIGLSLKLLYLGFPPKASTPWVQPGERYRAHCVHSNGANVLMVKAASPFTVLPLAAPTPDWGLHLADVNLPLGNLTRIVTSEIATYTAQAPVPTTQATD